MLAYQYVAGELFKDLWKLGEILDCIWFTDNGIISLED